ncbi:hypothetical protein MHI43_07460 [Paenibacillus sp. FSL H8-0457]|uniref:hypothetical protein n=1 Tax=unclassified Paenibacillus TaxID=185978 RepID=UPI0001788288|nr:hypothetical protein [Paenibacillus sp. Y412MC10]
MGFVGAYASVVSTSQSAGRPYPDWDKTSREDENPDLGFVGAYASVGPTSQSAGRPYPDWDKTSREDENPDWGSPAHMLR